MKKVRVGINGFGRIGRAFLRLAWGRPDIDVIAINDLGSLESLAYLLEFDSVYHDHRFSVSFTQGIESYLVVTDNVTQETKNIQIFSVKDPAQIPWGSVQVETVVESTGLFTEYGKASAHLTSGARRVVITAPAKQSENSHIEGTTILAAINDADYNKSVVTSNASCTTNATSPLIAILDEHIGIEKAILNTVHAYTATQALIDGPSKKDLREGRAAALNIVPSSTGAAVAVGEVYKNLKGKFDGVSMRVPVPSGSIVDITFIAKRDTTVEEVNATLENATRLDRWKGIFAISQKPLVSSDIVGNTHASIADLPMTRVVGGNLVKVLAWYDNEMGYTHTLLRHVILASSV